MRGLLLSSRLIQTCVAVVVVAVFCGLGSPGFTGKAFAADSGQERALLDLNSASLEEVLALPIPEELARRLVDYRDYVRYYLNIYELMDVTGMTAEIFQEIKPLVSTMPPGNEDSTLQRLSASYRQVQRYLGQEGSSEGLVDEYLDKMRNPENINDMDLFDLMSYQNVSPVDATNIIKARDRLGKFESGRQVRNSEGLRYFAYRNLRDFVVYDESEKRDESSSRITGYVQTRYHETPLANEDGELGNFGLMSADHVPRTPFLVGELKPYQPGWLNKMRINDANGMTAGVLFNREYGEEDFNETIKGYVGITDQKFGDFRLKSAYLGNFRVAYGLGLVMDNTDFIHFRKTGFGFNKRLLGVHGDLSRSYEYHLTGGAMEGSYGPVNASFFVSSGRKDGILNPDGTINRYVTLAPRPEPEWLEERVVDGTPTGLRRGAFQEDMVGGNIKLMLAPGSFIGVTGYEARYDRGWNADETTLVADTDLLEARDNEIWNSYTSTFTDEDGTVTEHKFRRVLGMEAQTVFNNVSLQGEYAFIQDPRNNLFSSKNPDALIVNAFSQWNNLHFLAVYRDYDVGFDNPYNRAFSNDNRYEMTLLSAPYRLKDDMYWALETATPQPKPEKGLFLETRYRVSQKFTISGLQFDKWQRKADGADMMRYTLKAEYQPIFNLRFRVRHRYSSRSEMNPDDVRAFKNWETRWQVISMLSNYNRIGLSYMTSNVVFPARQRLGGTVVPGGDPAVGTAGMPAHAFEARYEHNLTKGLKFTLGSSVYDGFFWNFEGNEFVLLDGKGFRNWFKVESRVSDRMLFQLKVTRDHNLPQTYLDVRMFNDPVGNDPDSDYAPKDQTFVRLQMDYTF
jgi:DNA uptake protein ComE-like DNA-binding protein